MPMSSNKFTSCLQKRQAGFKSVNNPSDGAILSMAVDSQSFFRRDVPRLLPRRENERIDDVFHGLRSEANRELASLLRDVRIGSHGSASGDTRSQPVSELLLRAVRCAAKQYMLQAELGNLALTDELTGLYNRRGFMAIAERQLKVGRRSGRGMLLFFIDVDRLKQINDSFGHAEGDRVLKHITEALQKTFRDSDVIARMGGDEFVVLAIEASDFSEGTIRARLCKYFKSIVGRESRYSISISLGAARFDPRGNASLGELIVQADRAMYQQKRHSATPSIASGAKYRSQ